VRCTIRFESNFCQGAFIDLGGKLCVFVHAMTCEARFQFTELEMERNQPALGFGCRLVHQWRIFFEMLGDVICHAFLYTRQEIVENFLYTFCFCYYFY